MKGLIRNVDNPGSFALPHNRLFLNDSDVVIEGAELGARFTFVDSSSLYIGYVFTDFDYVASQYRTDDLSSIKMAPGNSLSLQYTMELETGFTAVIGYYYTGKIRGRESTGLEVVRQSARGFDIRLA